MKKALLLLIPLMIFISCEDEKEDGDVSAFVGIWDLTFMGEYENSDCTGSLDSTDWALAQAFGFTATMILDGDGTAEMTMSILGETQTENTTWSESSDGTLILSGGDVEGFLSADGSTISATVMEDAFCEDPWTYEETSHTDSTSCADADNDWVEGSCLLQEFTKQ